MHLFTIGEEKIEATLLRRGSGYVLLHGEDEYPVALREVEDGSVEIAVGSRVWRAHIAGAGDDTFVRLNGECHAVRWSNPLVRLALAGGGALDDIAQAPMPGTVTAVHVRPGERVTRGQTMIVIESMKLETAIVAWRDGMVKTVHLALGQSFDRAARLVTLEAQAQE